MFCNPLKGQSQEKKWYQLKAQSSCIRTFLKSQIFVLRFSPPSTRKRRFRATKTQVFENSPRSGVLWKRRLNVFMWKDENRGFWKRWCHKLYSACPVRDAIVFPLFKRFRGCVSGRKLDCIAWRFCRAHHWAAKPNLLAVSLPLPSGREGGVL